jgi:hypothetical protein
MMDGSLFSIPISGRRDLPNRPCSIPAAAKRGGFRASRSLNVNSDLDIRDAERALRRHIDSGRVVIFRAIDGREMPSVPSASVVTGFVLGADREDADHWHATIMKCLD